MFGGKIGSKSTYCAPIPLPFAHYPHVVLFHHQPSFHPFASLSSCLFIAYSFGTGAKGAGEKLFCSRELYRRFRFRRRALLRGQKRPSLQYIALPWYPQRVLTSVSSSSASRSLLLGEFRFCSVRVHATPPVSRASRLLHARSRRDFQALAPSNGREQLLLLLREVRPVPALVQLPLAHDSYCIRTYVIHLRGYHTLLHLLGLGLVSHRHVC